MKILAIETSCDDTAIAILEVKGKKNPCFFVLSNIVSSQVKLHSKYGGVYPFLAKREHQKNLPLVLKKALKKAGLKIFNLQSSSFKPKTEKQGRLKGKQAPKIDLIAATVGPGLEPCLWTGVNFAIDLAEKANIPLVPINHIEAHIFANFIGKNLKAEGKKSKLLPAICLVASGGHTQIILVEKLGKYKIIGETRDDAAGECFDKTARILGLGYPGGPAIAAHASKAGGGRASATLPRPMLSQKNYDFSFSGLKTAVLYEFKKRSPKTRKSKEYIQEMCAEIQQAIIDVLIKKTIKAAKDHKAKTIMISGGVTANNELRKQFEEKVKKEVPKTKFLKPSKEFCTDNAAMVAITAYFNKNKAIKKNWKNIKANANLRV